jgi:integrase
VLHLRVHGKGGKVRYLPLHPGTAELVTDYLEAAGHGGGTAAALFRPVKNNTGGMVATQAHDGGRGLSLRPRAEETPTQKKAARRRLVLIQGSNALLAAARAGLSGLV